jgi:RNA polymerase sigma-70 factor (ECF subfamily)
MPDLTSPDVRGPDVVRALLAGGREAWDGFVRDTRLVVLKAVNTAARRFGARADDVEDAANQVYVELLEGDSKVLRAYRGESALTTWLTVIAYRVASREFARQRRQRPAEIEEPSETPKPPDGEILERLTRLPDQDRRALVLFHVHDASYKEISVRLAIPLSQVGMVLLRAREKLARLLQRPAP